MAIKILLPLGKVTVIWLESCFLGGICEFTHMIKNIRDNGMLKPVTDEQVFYDKFLCDKFYLLVCTHNFDNSVFL